MTTQIYTLTDPNTNEIRYVGKANNPKTRYYQHCRISTKKTHKTNWINKLLINKQKPIIEIIDTVPINEWIFWETYWISQFKAWGFNLVNNTHGGDGCTFGNQTSFKKGSVPKNKGVALTSEAKEHLRKINLGKKTNDETKNKMSKSQKKVIRTDFKLLIESSGKTRFKKGDSSWNKGLTNQKRKSKEIEQLDSNDNIVGEYKSYIEAAIKTNGSAEVIRKCCNGLSKTSGGFKWRYKINKNE